MIFTALTHKYFSQISSPLLRTPSVLPATGLCCTSVSQTSTHQSPPLSLARQFPRGGVENVRHKHPCTNPPLLEGRSATSENSLNIILPHNYSTRTSNSSRILLRGVRVDHICCSRTTFSSSRLEFSKKVPVRSDVTFWQPFRGQQKQMSSGYRARFTMRQSTPHTHSLSVGRRCLAWHLMSPVSDTVHHN